MYFGAEGGYINFKRASQTSGMLHNEERVACSFYLDSTYNVFDLIEATKFVPLFILSHAGKGNKASSRYAAFLTLRVR